MTNGAQGGQPGNQGGWHGGTGWASAALVVSTVVGLLYQVQSCGAHSPDPAPTTTVTETADTDVAGPTENEVPPSPTVSGRIKRIVDKGRDAGNASYQDIEVDAELSGLQGQECVIKWASYYPDGHGGGTGTGYTGSESTGLLPYDPTENSTTLTVHRAQYATWMVHVFLYGPDGELLDAKDGPTG
ncbi:hypothetical protein [Streptomyces spinosus]|uniref:hypothetical protein n=1 Tax=Streptomyces spinosus TaxID=2872623 RepID=UPI001CECCC37|nr:hypothetical protein [Streptomyces spinosus]